MPSGTADCVIFHGAEAGDVGKILTSEEAIVFEDVKVVTPAGATLVEDLSLRVPRGTNLLVTGPNGSGRLWPAVICSLRWYHRSSVGQSDGWSIVWRAISAAWTCATCAAYYTLVFLTL